MILMPTLPRVLLSPMAVAPQISEQKTSGTTSICIRRMKP